MVLKDKQRKLLSSYRHCEIYLQIVMLLAQNLIISEIVRLLVVHYSERIPLRLVRDKTDGLN